MLALLGSTLTLILVGSSPIQAADNPLARISHAGCENCGLTLQVRHDHFIGGGHGQLTIDEEGITFESEKKEPHSRKWKYANLQEVKIETPTRFQILTYEDVWWKCNRDRLFEFKVLGSQITPEVVQLLRRQLPALVVSAVFEEPEDVAHSFLAKHRHALGGGCEGELIFSEGGIYYASSKSEHSRFWPFHEIRGLGRTSLFDLRVTVLERSSTLGSERNFRFQLKHPMGGKVFEDFWRTVYEPKSWMDR